jgi:hypothetical protein
MRLPSLNDSAAAVVLGVEQVLQAENCAAVGAREHLARPRDHLCGRERIVHVWMRRVQQRSHRVMDQQRLRGGE